MIYVTYKGIKSTVLSMVAVNQLPQAQANAVLELAEELRLGECNWAALKQSIESLIDGGYKIVQAIETDATVNSLDNPFP